jgi:hypothetical protein
MTSQRSYFDDLFLVGMIFLSAISNFSPVSPTPSFRAVSMNRSDCAFSVNLGFGFAFGFLIFTVWPLGR